MFHLKSCQEVRVAGTQRAGEGAELGPRGGSRVRTGSMQPGHEGRPLQSERRSTTSDAPFNWATLGTTLRTASRRTGLKPGEHRD